MKKRIQILIVMSCMMTLLLFAGCGNDTNKSSAKDSQSAVLETEEDTASSMSQSDMEKENAKLMQQIEQKPVVEDKKAN